MPDHYAVLGTDGYGVSESREDLRDHFEVSPKYIVLAALKLLVEKKEIKAKVVTDYIDKYEISIDKLNPMTH